MDEPCAVDAKVIGAPTASKYTVQETEELKQQYEVLSDSSNSQRKIKNDVLAGKLFAKISAIILMGIGIAELIVASLVGSAAMFAGGMNSLSYAMISFNISVGLYMVYYPADVKFHFGYHKVESFVALMAAMGMVAMGLVTIYHSYQSSTYPHEIKQPHITMFVLSLSTAISFYNAFQMRILAKKYNILSFQMYATSFIRGSSISTISLLSVLVATQLRYLQMDTIGSLIIAGYIFYVAYVSLKRSSLNLIDAWDNPKIIDKIRNIIQEDKKFKEIVKVNSILLRPSGITGAHAEIQIEVDGSITLTKIELLCIQIETAIRSEISIMNRISIIPHARSDLNQRIIAKATTIN
jgi:cation diffusion facilitator family transporter